MESDDKDQYNKFLLNKWKVDKMCDCNEMFTRCDNIILPKWYMK